MDIRNLNDQTDPEALGPSQMGMKLKTMTSYTESGLPRPPGGWNRNLGYDVKYDSNTCVVSDGSV